MAKTPGISDAEWTIMEALWRDAPQSAGEIHEELTSETGWHLKTVHTLLGRMVKKGVLRREKSHGINVFTPVVERDACLREASQSFLSRYFQANMAPMLAHYLEREEVTDDELDEMRRLLDGMRGERGGREQ